MDPNTAPARVSPARRGPVVVGVVAALVGLGVAVLLFRGYGTGEVGFGPRGYTVTSDRQVQIVFEVDKEPSATAVCTVRARDRTGLEAGSALVRVGPSSGRRQVVTYDLATTARANTGEITSCLLDRGAGPPRP